MTIVNGFKSKPWPVGSLLSIIGHVLEDNVIDFSVALVLTNKKSFVNKNFPEYNMVRAIMDVYNQWEKYQDEQIELE